MTADLIRPRPVQERCRTTLHPPALEDQPRLIRNVAASFKPHRFQRHARRATLPEEQAEPDDAATPSRSSAIARVCAAIPGAAKALVLGRRGALIPRNRASGSIAAIRRSASSRSPASRCDSRPTRQSRPRKPPRNPPPPRYFRSRRGDRLLVRRHAGSSLLYGDPPGRRPEPRRRPARRAYARKRTKHPRPMSRMLHCNAPPPASRRRPAARPPREPASPPRRRAE